MDRYAKELESEGWIVDIRNMRIRVEEVQACINELERREVEVRRIKREEERLAARRKD